jgi:hypothetical protein
MSQVKELRDIDRDIIEDDLSYLYIKILVGIFMIGIVWAICYYCSNYFSLPNIFVTEKIVVQKISTEKTSGIKFAKIQDIQVGERAIGTNPEVTDFDREIFLPDPEPATWRKLTLEMLKPDGKRLDITLLRPLNWIDGAKATIDATIYLDLPEMGAQGLAKVLNIEPCSTIKRGKGNVITGTFHHEAANTIDVHIEGLSKPIGCTDNHPFWSVTRNEFIEAGKLQQGEKLQLHNGQTAKVIQILPRPGPERVHNLEVMNEHVYRVSNRGVLVHNVCEPRWFRADGVLRRYDGPKPTYTINEQHVPGPNYNPNKTPLPPDAELVFTRAVPNDPDAPRAWFGKNDQGQIYRFSADSNGTAHFSGIAGVGNGTRNLSPYSLMRLSIDRRHWGNYLE